VVSWPKSACMPCPARPLCTSGSRRQITLRPRELPEALAEYRDKSQDRQDSQGRTRPGRDARHPQPLSVQPPGPLLERGDFARFLPESLDDADAANGLLHVLGNISGTLQSRPGSREKGTAGFAR